MEVIIESIIQVLVIVVFGIFFVLAILYLIKKDEDPKAIVTDREYSIVGLFLLPIFEIIFVLDIIDDFLIKDLSLVIFEIVVVITLSIFTVDVIKIWKKTNRR